MLAIEDQAKALCSTDKEVFALKNDTLSSKSMPHCKPINRVDYILSLCRGRRVLHIGCVDYPLLLERIADGTLLHSELKKVASTLWGIDRDGAGIAALKQMMNSDNFVIGDAEQLEPSLFPCNFDIVLVAEVLEHLSCPGALLRSVPALLGPCGKLVVTVPNAHSLRNFAHAILSREKVHSDHKFWFSFFTIKALLVEHGFSKLDLLPYCQPARSKGIAKVWDLLVRSICKRRPWMAEGIVAISSSMLVNEENKTEKL